MCNWQFSVYRSRYQLSYQEAQNLLDDIPPTAGAQVAATDRPKLQESLRLLAALTDRLSGARIEVHSLEIWKGSGITKPMHLAVIAFLVKRGTHKKWRIVAKQEEIQNPIFGRVAEHALFSGFLIVFLEKTEHQNSCTQRGIFLQAGALELEGAELHFQTKQSDGAPEEVSVKEEIPMMRVVAEMMIWANSAVARQICDSFPGAALLRRHSPPRPEGLKEVRFDP